MRLWTLTFLSALLSLTYNNFRQKSMFVLIIFKYAEAKFQAEKQDGAVSEQTHLLYAWSLIRSLYRSDKVQGVQEFESEEPGGQEHIH
jgi:hypothetical protein